MRRYLTISAVVVSIICIIASWLYINSFQKITITYNRSHGSIVLKSDVLRNPITIISNQEITVKKGHYQLVTSGTNVKQTTEDIDVGGQPIKRTIYIPLDEGYLQKQLAVEQQAIDHAITNEYPAISNLYIVNPGKLYGRGEWYGTTLTYKGTDSDNRDTLRLLLKKETKSWLLVTKPPQPLLSAKQLSDVPSYILRDINKPAYLPGTTTSPAIQPE